MDETKGNIISEEVSGEFRTLETPKDTATTSSLKDLSSGVQGVITETTNRILEALKDFPEKLFALISLIGFVLVAFSGNMKEWKSFLIFLSFVVIDIGFLIIYEKYLKNKN